MNVSTWCIKNPIAAIMFFVMLCFAGVLGYQNMKVQKPVNSLSPAARRFWQMVIW